MSQLSTPPLPDQTDTSKPARVVRGRTRRRATSLFAHGEPMVWLTGGALGLCLVMISGLLLLVLSRGLPTFWPTPILELVTHTGERFTGEVAAFDSYRPEPQAPPEGGTAPDVRPGFEQRRMLRTGNYDLTGVHFRWIAEVDVASERAPEWMLAIERMEWGRFFGAPLALDFDGVRTEGDPARVWSAFDAAHQAARKTWRERRRIEVEDIGAAAKIKEQIRLAVREAELRHGANSREAELVRSQSAARLAEADSAQSLASERVEKLKALNTGRTLTLVTGDGVQSVLALDQIVRAYPANRLGLGDKLGVYLSRVGEFLLDEPRESNSEGGVFPAIFGTVLMTLIMSILVVPFGVLAALYLREYAKPGPLVSAVRIAINNLAGVPSIVFGVFGVGFFCYWIGAGIDELFFSAKLPSPTYGKGGLLWAALTLALLTLPVVIVPSEEALAAVPRSMREGSYACGATKWQTIWRIVLPRAMPGIMTGMILALARGAGEVAPLMLVGASKLAAELPLDGTFPYLHPERSFMHLGFHIYDLGFQSQNSEAAKPMVYTTTLLLIALVVVLNLVAIWVRARLRRRFQGAQL